MDLKGLTRGPVVLQWAYRGSRGSSECLQGVQRVLRRLTWVQRSLIGLTWGPKGPQKGWRGPEGLRGVQMDLKGLTWGPKGPQKAYSVLEALRGFTGGPEGP